MNKSKLFTYVKEMITSMIFLLIGLVLFLRAWNMYLVFIVPFIPVPIPFWIVGIGLMLFGLLGLILTIKVMLKGV